MKRFLILLALLPFFLPLFAPSVQSGVSIPHQGQWRSTAVSSHFDTFYSQRYLTTLVDFGSKWADLMDRGAGLYEGGGYQSKGMYRPAPDCRMKTNECEGFCPVCTRAIVRMIDFYTR